MLKQFDFTKWRARQTAAACDVDASGLFVLPNHLLSNEFALANGATIDMSSVRAPQSKR